MHTTNYINEQEKIDWIRLARSENVGKATFFRLLTLFGTAKNALDGVCEQAFQGGLGRKIKLCSEAGARKELENTNRFGAQIVLYADEAYPRLLREIDDPPPIITTKGDLELFDQYSMAVVGPRNASFNGIAFAKRIAADLGDNSLIVTSGLAKGIDCAAHKASLKTGTVAVIAGGIDHVYPKENSDLYDAIFENGLVISESPFGVPPKGGNFVQRNRIISGVSLGVIVVEAGLRSGSLTTARFAIEQGREVFSVPGSPFDPRCHGTNRLIKQGAILTEGIKDILDDIVLLKENYAQVGVLKEPEVEEYVAPPPIIPSEADINKVREEIASKISFVPISIEGIIQELQVSPRLVNIAIVQLELANKAEVKLGKVSLTR